MGRISGWLWIVGALVGAVAAFLPGADHDGARPGSSALERARLPLRRRQRHRPDPLGARLDERAGDRHGGDDPGRRPRDLPDRRLAQLHRAAARLLAALRRLLLPRPLGLAALDRARSSSPARRCSTTPSAIDNAFLPRYLALAAGFLAATWVMVGLKRRLVAAEARQRDIANRDPLTGVGNRRAFDAILQRELAARTGPPRPPRRRRQPARPADPRPRRLQGRQRRARPPGRRRGPLRGRRRAPTRSCARPTPSPGSAATSSP